MSALAMDGTALLVMLLVVGAPLALFFAMRRHPGGSAKAPPQKHERKPPADFGMAREASDPAPARADGETTSSAIASGAAAAAAGGAYILAAARHRASEGGGESPQAQTDGPDGGRGAAGGGEGSAGEGGSSA